MTSSTDPAALFETRYRRAFPGTRGVTFYEAPAEIEMRLSRLFETPPMFVERAPVFWSRGAAGEAVERFAWADGVCWLNGMALAPRLMAAAHGSAVARKFFVYLEMEEDALLLASSASPLMSGVLEETVSYLLRMCLEIDARAFVPEIFAAQDKVRYRPYG